MLTASQEDKIASGLANGASLRAIAKTAGVSVATVVKRRDTPKANGIGPIAKPAVKSRTFTVKEARRAVRDLYRDGQVETPPHFKSIDELVKEANGEFNRLTMPDMTTDVLKAMRAMIDMLLSQR